MSVPGFDFPLGIWATKVITPCSSITDPCPPERMSSLLPIILQQLDRTVVTLLALDNRGFTADMEEATFFPEDFKSVLPLYFPLFVPFDFVGRRRVQKLHAVSNPHGKFSRAFNSPHKRIRRD